MSGWNVVEIDDVAALDTPPTEGGRSPHVWKPLREHLGIGAFGVNAWVGPSVGDYVIQPHDEIWDGVPDHEELYVLIRGAAEMTLDGETVPMRSGTCVFVRPEVHRAAVATQPGTIVLAIGARAGSIFQIGAWEQELRAVARPLEEQAGQSVTNEGGKSDER